MSYAEVFRKAGRRNGEITLQRMRIFWAVAHSETLTKAAKQLGLSQPTLSQQIASLEAAVGTPLFERRSNQMILTEAGHFLLRKAESVLRNMQELEDGLAEFSDGVRVTLRIAGLSSMLRLVLPPAIARNHELFPDVEYDIHDCAPPDILEMLYGRRANIGLINAGAVASASTGFMQVPLLEDPYVLAVPKRLELEGVVHTNELTPEAQELLNRSIRFSFGSAHSEHVQEWYADLLPDNRPIASTRGYGDALALVRAGMGVCLTPALACIMDSTLTADLNLYRVSFPPRKIVALVPTQYRRTQPFASFLEALQEASASLKLPPMMETPPLLAGG